MLMLHSILRVRAFSALHVVQSQSVLSLQLLRLVQTDQGALGREARLLRHIAMFAVIPGLRAVIILWLQKWMLASSPADRVGSRRYSIRGIDLDWPHESACG
jgi:hypothetical protein